ncbi:alkane 1-monooxygenase [Inhella gelatinilytica]|uniref:Fatty acid desaturase n=1 Tax=Inhella gelatinilytica TaxID=2795030 RepID=A0A931ISG6_9BURK|nr:alkane 1-monooxygenase [Inhella gelatinilytica]MBH9551857.1 fatty acid desaturase [Inhella gelatinilytica]
MSPAAPAPDRDPGCAPYRDPKRYAWLLSALFPLTVVWHLLRFEQTGWLGWLFITPLVIYGVLPLLDALIPLDERNPPEAAVRQLEGDPWYPLLTALFVPLYFGLVLQGTAVAVAHAGEPGVWLGLVLSVGALSGAAINTAHELGHKHPAWERWMARVALAPVAYGHFFVEHNRGHHQRVATFEDPASARLGESFWAFLPRTVLGSVRSAWRLERARLAGRNLGPWHWRNQCLQSWALTVGLFGALTAALGPWALLFLVLQAGYGFSLLEVVNYLEHYGLKRATGPNGKPERCRPEHSWNSNHVASNVFLYHLQRHSDHHAHPTRRYPALRHFPEAPQLPSGYAGMVLLAYVPWLWFKVMDPRVLAHYGGDLRRANVQPGTAWATQTQTPDAPDAPASPPAHP